MVTAGNGNTDIFTQPAIDEIYNFSKGVPRLINLACHNALISGLVYDTKKITKAIAIEAMNDINKGIRPSFPSNQFNKFKKEDEKISQKLNENYEIFNTQYR